MQTISVAEDLQGETIEVAEPESDPSADDDELSGNEPNPSELNGEVEIEEPLQLHAATNLKLKSHYEDQGPSDFDNDGAVFLNWSGPLQTVDSYEILFFATESCTGDVIIYSSILEEYFVTDLQEGAYSYIVRSLSSNGSIDSTCSQNIMVDKTPPSSPVDFNDGDTILDSLTESPVLSWQPAQDELSGLLGYEIALGTQSGSTDILDWSPVEEVTSHTLTGLSMTMESQYFASIRAVDKAGNTSDSLAGDGFFTRDSQILRMGLQLKAVTPDAGDQFGSKVAIHGDTMVVASPNEDSAARVINGNEADDSVSNSGAVFVYTRQNGVWVKQAYLKPFNTDFDDSFGYAIAIHGDTIAVSALGEDSAARRINGNPNDNSSQDSGAVYIFVRNGTTWTQQAYIKPSPAVPNEAFGKSISIEGNTVVVGASVITVTVGNPAISNAGGIYVFVRNGAAWSQQAYLRSANGNQFDFFGNQVAISGNSVVVGAPGGGNDSAGEAYVFVRTGVTWSRQAILRASNAERNDFFGSQVDIDGNTIVVGAKDEHGNGSSPTDNSLVDVGAAYVFVRNGTAWSQQAYLKASHPSSFDYFGCNVSLSGDQLVVGARGEDSDTAGINGLPNENLSRSGAAYVFRRTGVTWTQEYFLKAFSPKENDLFGNQIAIDAKTIIIGVPNDDKGIGLSAAPSSGMVQIFSPLVP